jgi:hypothetical protein
VVATSERDPEDRTLETAKTSAAEVGAIEASPTTRSSSRPATRRRRNGRGTTRKGDPDEAVGGSTAESRKSTGDNGAASIHLNQGGAGAVTGGNVSIVQGGASRVHGKSVSVNQGGAMVIRGDRVTVEQGGALAFIANRIEARDAGAMFLIARQVSGDVRVLVDWRAVAAVIGGLILLGLLRGRR